VSHCQFGFHLQEFAEDIVNGIYDPLKRDLDSRSAILINVERSGGFVEILNLVPTTQYYDPLGGEADHAFPTVNTHAFQIFSRWVHGWTLKWRCLPHCRLRPKALAVIRQVG